MAEVQHQPRDEESGAAQTGAEPQPTEAAAEAGGRFVGQWNRLVSTTNWEKGRIICQWRQALIESGAPATAYSDEAWAQLVGGVTSQHVGRLRRVFERFGDVQDQYEGLYWSHFQAAIDWDDAEMWLEGAIRNRFSVSQMRGKRWETLGGAGQPPAEDDVELEAAIDSGADAQAVSESPAVTSEQTDVRSPDRATVADEPEADAVGDAEAVESAGRRSVANRPTVVRREPLSVDVDQLPDDVADAFEQFKLAIIAHRRSNWTETTPEAVIECLDALRELTLAAPD